MRNTALSVSIGSRSSSSGKIERNRNPAAFLKAPRVPPQARQQSRLFDHRRMKHVRQSPDLSDGKVGDGEALLDGLARRRIGSGRRGLQPRQVHAQRDEVLRHRVVKLASDAAPLLILHPVYVSRPDAVVSIIDQAAHAASGR